MGTIGYTVGVARFLFAFNAGAVECDVPHVDAGVCGEADPHVELSTAAGGERHVTSLSLH